MQKDIVYAQIIVPLLTELVTESIHKGKEFDTCVEPTLMLSMSVNAAALKKVVVIQGFT